MITVLVLAVDGNLLLLVVCTKEVMNDFEWVEMNCVV